MLDTLRLISQGRRRKIDEERLRLARETHSLLVTSTATPSASSGRSSWPTALLGRKIAGKSQRELTDLGLVVENPATGASR